MWLLLGRKPAQVAKQYINTTEHDWLAFYASVFMQCFTCDNIAAFSGIGYWSDCKVPAPLRQTRIPTWLRFMRQSRTMASVRKPVIVRKFSREWYAGYAGAGLGLGATELEILDPTGKVLRMGWEQVKWVCYVRDLPAASGSQSDPERLLHKRFSIRPRTAGLWLRMTLTDGEELEGLAANDRSLVEGAGLLLTPPDTRSNTQRIYIPRQAIQTLEVVSLIGSASRRPSRSQPADQAAGSLSR
jgi:hypothetical protein